MKQKAECEVISTKDEKKHTTYYLLYSKIKQNPSGISKNRFLSEIKMLALIVKILSNFNTISIKFYKTI